MLLLHWALVIRDDLRIQLCHTHSLDFANFAILENVLEGALEHLLNTNGDRAHSVLLEVLGSLESQANDRLAALLIQNFWDSPLAELILRLTRTDFSVNFSHLFSKNGAF
jgi:hypothetical protein